MSDSAGLTITTEDVLAPDVRIENPPVGRRDLWRRISRPRAFASALHRALATLANTEASDVATLVEEHDVTALREQDIGPYEFDAPVYAMLAHGAAMGEPGMRRELLAVTQHLGGPVLNGAVNSSLDAIQDGPLAVLDAADEHPQVVIHLTSSFWSDYHRTERERFLRFVVELTSALDVRLVCSTLVARKLVEDHGDDLPASVCEAVQTRSNAPAGTRARREATVDAAERALDEFDPSSDRYRGWWEMLWTIYETPAERRKQAHLHQDVRIDVDRTAISKRVGALSDHGLVETPDINGHQHVRLTPAGVVAVEQYLEEHGRPDESRDGAGNGHSRSGRPPDPAVGSTGHTGETADQPEAGPSSGGPDGERARETRATDDSRSERPADPAGADVSDPPTSSAGSVYPQRGHGRGEVGRSDRPAAEGEAATGDAGPAARDGRRTAPRSAWMDRYRHEATFAAASDGDFVLCDRPATDRTTPGDQLVSYSADRDEVVVSVEADKSVARLGVRLCDALLSEELLRSVLTPRKLDGTDVALGGLATDNVYVLQKGRCLGYLKRDEANGADYQRRLRQARNDLSKLSGRLSDDEGQFDAGVASALASESLGLAGTALHVYDLLDVDVTVEIEFPEFSRNHFSNAPAVTRFLSKLARIASRKGHYSAQRVLYEPREDKREDSLGAPRVDYADPTGTSTTNWVLSGPGIDKLAAPLRAALDDPPDDDLQEDGANFSEFVVDVDVVQGWRREAVAELLARMATFKNLHATRQVLAMLRALCGSVLDVGRAIGRLKGEDEERELDLNELRSGLVEGLPPGRILPDAGGSTVSKAVHALLAVDEPVSTSDLADLAGVSKQSLRDNRDRLEAVGLVVIEDGDPGDPTTWRATLPFDDDRHAEFYGSSGSVPVVRFEDAPPLNLFRRDGFGSDFGEAVGLLLYRLDRDDPDVRDAVSSWSDGPPDVRPVVEAWPDLRPWLDVLAALSGHGYRLASDGEAPEVEHGTGGWSRTGGPPTAEEWARGPLRVSSTVGTRPPQRQASLTDWPDGGGGPSSPVEG